MTKLHDKQTSSDPPFLRSQKWALEKVLQNPIYYAVNVLITCSSSAGFSPSLHFLVSLTNFNTRRFTLVICLLILLNLLRHSAADTSTLALTTFLIVLALIPNLNVETVSASLYAAGDAQMMMVVLEFPPKLCCEQRPWI